MISLDPAHADAIREGPGDDAPRLAAAKQMPGERGELVRVQCALASATANERPRLEQRERELLRLHEEAWTGAWRHAAQSWRWSRGFVEEIHLRASLVLAESLAAIGASEPGVRTLCLVLGRCSLGVGAVRELGKSRRLQALVELFIPGNAFGDAGAEALAASSRLARLSRLDVSYCGIGDAGAAALASSPHLAGITELVLTGNVLRHPGQKRLRDRFGDRVRLDRQGEFQGT